jgi:hypothetical protein
MFPSGKKTVVPQYTYMKKFTVLYCKYIDTEKTREKEKSWIAARLFSFCCCCKSLWCVVVLATTSKLRTKIERYIMQYNKVKKRGMGVKKQRQNIVYFFIYTYSIFYVSNLSKKIYIYTILKLV